MVFQDPSASLHPQITVGRQLTDHMRHHLGLSKARRPCTRRRAARAGARSARRGRLQKYPHQFSGGQRQRIAIAIALACDPEVLLADEPTTALDVTVQAGVLHLLRELVDRHAGSAVLLVTHDLGVMSAVADEVTVMRRGSSSSPAPREQLFTAPQHDYTRSCWLRCPSFRTRWSTGPSTAMRPPPTAAADPTARRRRRSGGDPMSGRKPVLARRRPRRRVRRRPALRAVDGVCFDVASPARSSRSSARAAAASRASRAPSSASRSPRAGTCVLRRADVPAARPAPSPPAMTGMQMVFQDPNSSLNPRRRVGEQIADGVRAALARGDEGSDPSRLAARSDSTATMVNRYPHEFSGGQKQRIAIARALAARPRPARRRRADLGARRLDPDAASPP